MTCSIRWRGKTPACWHLCVVGIDASRASLRLSISRMGGLYWLRGRPCSKACVAHILEHLSSPSAVVSCGAIIAATAVPTVVLRGTIPRARGAVWRARRIRKIVGGLIRSRSRSLRVLSRGLRRCIRSRRGLVRGVLRGSALLLVLVVIVVVVGRHGCDSLKVSRLSSSCRPACNVEGHGEMQDRDRRPMRLLLICVAHVRAIQH